jgi:hypothetical protein
MIALSRIYSKKSEKSRAETSMATVCSSAEKSLGERLAPQRQAGIAKLE